MQRGDIISRTYKYSTQRRQCVIVRLDVDNILNSEVIHLFDLSCPNDLSDKVQRTDLKYFLNGVNEISIESQPAYNTDKERTADRAERFHKEQTWQSHFWHGNTHDAFVYECCTGKTQIGLPARIGEIAAVTISVVSLLAYFWIKRKSYDRSE